MSASTYLQGSWLNTLRGKGNGTSFTAPAAVYAQLHIGDPGEAGTSNQSTNTVRKEIGFAAAVAAAGTLTSNIDAQWLSIGVTTTEQLTYFSLWDASSAGNCLGSGPLTATVQVNPGDNFTLTTGTVVWTTT